MIKTIKLTITELDFLAKFLADMLLHGTDLRSRNRIIDLITPKLKEYEQNRLEIVSKHSVEEDGKLKIENGNYVIKEGEMEAFNQEIGEFFKEDILIDILPANEKEFEIVKNLVLNSDKEMNYNEGKVYERVCEILNG